jgi:dolichyl-phosphate-mannose-protein mannosyltransferase
MPTPPPDSLRNRKAPAKQTKTTPLYSSSTLVDNGGLPPEPYYKDKRPVSKSEWDFKLALVVVTIAAFITRFWGIRHPNQVVFDEVHFGKVN